MRTRYLARVLNFQGAAVTKSEVGGRNRACCCFGIVEIQNEASE